MNKKLILLFIIIFTYNLHTLYSLDPGSQLWYSGFNGGISAQGYAGIGAKKSGFYSFINPATSATVENIRIFTSGNIMDTNWGGSFGISSPIKPGGTLYVGSQFLSFDETSMTHIGYGKKVRSDLAFGIEGILTIHPSALKNGIGGGLSLGVLWMPKDFSPITDSKIWGFTDFSLGGTIKTIFFPTGQLCFNPIPEMLFQIGMEATFLKYKMINWRFLVDYTIGFVPLSTPEVQFQTWMSLGTVWAFWDIWDISMGLILGNNGLGFGANQLIPFTFGTALGYEWDHFSFKFSYAFGANKFFEETEYLNTIGLELGIGTKKSTNMSAILNVLNSENSTNYFSPNNDLIQDDVYLLPSIIGSLPVNAWRINILDSKGKVIRTFEDNKQKIDKKFTANQFFYNYFSPTTSYNLPSKIVWDGKDNNNKIAPEGTYYAVMHLRYSEDQSTTSATNTIILDITKPSAKLSISEKDRFVYLGDDPTSSFTIKQELSSTDPWSAKFIDNIDNKKIDDWVWGIEKAPPTNTWQLKNPKRINIASGEFSYIVTSYDKAGNFTEESITNIIIETKERTTKITSKQLKFSPNEDGFLDTILIDVDYITTAGLQKSCLIVYNTTGQKIYSQEQNIAKLSTNLIWDGKNNAKKIASDGQYLIILEQHFIDKQIDTAPLIVYLDTTAPIFDTQFSPNRFSPDSDGIDDVLKIDFFAEDLHNISNWTITIKNKEEILQTFKGTTNKTKLFWYPNSDSPLKSHDTLSFEIYLQDTLGNKIDTLFHQIKIDLLTDFSDKNLITTETIAYFEPGMGIISGQIFTYLDEVWLYYQENPQDKIKILTQAYYEESEHSKTEAYKLGIMRGDAIKQYLINKGIQEKNIEVEVQAYDETNSKKQKTLRQAKIYITKIPK